MKNTPGPFVENIDEEAKIKMRNFEIVLIMGSHINPTSSATCQKAPKSKDHRSLVFLDIFKIPKLINHRSLSYSWTHFNSNSVSS